MTRFGNKEEFLLDGQPFKIFIWCHPLFPRCIRRIRERSLHNLKKRLDLILWKPMCLGISMKKEEEGTYDFSKILDLSPFSRVSAIPWIIRNRTSSPLYLCRMGIWWLACWLLTKECVFVQRILAS